MRLGELRPVRAAMRDLRLIAVPFRPEAGGAAAAWRAMQDWTRHRSLTVTTRADPTGGPVILTRIALNGDVRTKVDRAWLRATRPAPDSDLVGRHFRAVSGALAGWPAALALTRVLRWSGGTALMVLALRNLVLAGWQGLLRLGLDWRFWLPLLPFALGMAARPLLRLWLRRRFRLAIH